MNLKKTEIKLIKKFVKHARKNANRTFLIPTLTMHDLAQTRHIIRNVVIVKYKIQELTFLRNEGDEEAKHLIFTK